MVALSLGGVWAFQEASWGGFWNWDSSETFGALFLLSLVYLIHTKTTFNNWHLVSYYLLWSTFSLTITYCFIQMNFELTSHNFGTKFFHFFNHNVFYEEVIVILSIYMVCIVIRYLWLTSLIHNLISFTLKLKNLKPFMNWGVLWLIVIASFIVYSFNPLVNYFTHTTLGIDILNWNPKLFELVTTFIIVFSFLFIKASHRTMFTDVVIVSTLTNLPTYFALAIPFRWKWSQILHVLLLYIFILNLTSYFTTHMLWLLKTHTCLTYLASNTLSTGFFIWSCDAMFIEKASALISNNSVIDYWTLLFKFNKPKVNAFFLWATNLGCFSLYQLTFYYVSSFTLIINPQTFSIGWVLIVFIGMFYRFYYHAHYSTL